MSLLRRRRTTAAVIVVAALSVSSTDAFAFAPQSSHGVSYDDAKRRLSISPRISTTQTFRNRNIFQLKATKSDEDIKKIVSAMKAKEMRSELESYGISTKSFFEKSELVDALVKARKEGKKPIENNRDKDAPTAATSDTNTKSTTTKKDTANRDKRIKEEMEKCQKLKVGELKKELESAGISTKSYFEKSEFVRAVAELRVDGPPEKKSGGSSTRSTSSAGSNVKDEPRDKSYRDVVVTKFEGNMKAMLGAGYIDVKAKSDFR